MTDSSPQITDNHPGALFPDNVLLYDGDCGFCNASVDFVLRNEASPVLSFAPLQSGIARAIIEQHANRRQIPDSIVLFHGGRLLFESDAGLTLAVLMGGIWKFFGRVGFLFPRFVRDGVYRLIARYRYKLVKKKACRLYPPETMKRFLDNGSKEL